MVVESVENHADEVTNYYDENEMLDRRGKTFCTWRLTIIIFETDLENLVY